ncbi:hypothetical protein FB451DRAFT_1316108 [Mycena latifolia]|nr:hypothetical protein FB451DRAFT_1316108 [Mycena latifolia]
MQMMANSLVIRLATCLPSAIVLCFLWRAHPQLGRSNESGWRWPGRCCSSQRQLCRLLPRWKSTIEVERVQRGYRSAQMARWGRR